MWYRTVQAAVRNAELDRHLKVLIRQSPFFQKLFKHYGIDPKEAWHIQFKLGPLDGKFAETDGDDITFDPSAFKNGLESGLHFVAHELSHWLTSKREEQQYFSDPEEVKGFEWAIAHELSRGADMDQVEATFTPLLRPHFNSDSQAHQMLMKMIVTARKLMGR